jgi:hypothetical protein
VFPTPESPGRADASEPAKPGASARH